MRDTVVVSYQYEDGPSEAIVRALRSNGDYEVKSFQYDPSLNAVGNLPPLTSNGVVRGGRPEWVVQFESFMKEETIRGKDVYGLFIKPSGGIHRGQEIEQELFGAGGGNGSWVQYLAVVNAVDGANNALSELNDRVRRGKRSTRGEMNDWLNS